MPSLFHECVVDLFEEALSREIASAMRRLRTRAGRKLAIELGRVYKVGECRDAPTGSTIVAEYLQQGRSAAVELLTQRNGRRRSRIKEPDASWYREYEPCSNAW